MAGQSLLAVLLWVRILPAHLSAGSEQPGSVAQTDRLLKKKCHGTNKLYSIHEPNVECLAKGKAHTKYEFG